MTTGKLILRSLAFYWRTHAGVVAGTAVAAAVLVGALVVGNSVNHTLVQLALRRLGRTHLALASGDRFFRAEPSTGGRAADLAAALAAELGADVAPALLVEGSAKRPDGSARANRVQVVGVDERLWRVGGARDLLAGAGEEQAVVNARLAEQLGVRAGDEIVLRLPVPSGLPRDAPLATDRGTVAAPRPTVRAVAADAEFGRFSLRANQLAPFTVFLPMRAMQQRLGLAGRGNVLLVAGPTGQGAPATPEQADAALRKHWTLADADLTLRELPGDLAELRTGRIFLDRPVAEAALAVHPQALGVLTYLANEIRRVGGDANAPYCIVSAMAPQPPAPRPDSPGDRPRPGPPSPVPADLADNEIILNRWVAVERQVKGNEIKAGHEVRLTYWRPGPMRQFVEASRKFHVREIIPVRAPGADPNLLPDFPGLADEKDCRKWKPGVEIDLSRIKDKDQEYWDAYRGTPKAFVTLAAGREMWENRFGDLTAVRYPARGGEVRQIAETIRRRLDPAAIGLYFLPVREQALAAADPTSDFGGLFLGLSFFLIAAAVLLTALLFVFGVEQRSQQTGTLLALGFRPGEVRRLMLLEGGLLALAGSVLGAAAGLGYTRIVLYGLATVWRGASASTPIRFHAEPVTVVLGAVGGWAVAMAAVWLTLRRQGRAPARELLATTAAGRASAPAGRGKRLAAWSAGAACVVGAGVLAVSSVGSKGMAAAGAFFGAGGLLLVGGLSLCYALLAAVGAASHAAARSTTGLGFRTIGRRRWRSLATIGLLAFGVFLVAAVEVFRVDPTRHAERRSSGTGGFALYGESALPILHNLNDPARRRRLALDGEELRDMRVVQLRVREGDDASCLNLNRAQRPRLLGVRPEALRGRFTFVQSLPKPPHGAGGRRRSLGASRPSRGPGASGGTANAAPPGTRPSRRGSSTRPRASDDEAGGDPWALLSRDEGPGVVPAIADDPTITWAIGKKLGETIPYTDERGRRFQVRLVGMLAGSIFQGGLLISEEHFQRRFPSTSGYRALLVDAPAGRAEAARTALSTALEDLGVELTSAPGRLAAFNEVQNTYLSIFAALGGLGLLLGSVAMGVVLLRNVMERRGELALLRAVGFSRGQLRWMVLCEHWALLGLGLACGVISAAVAVLPALRSPGAEVPYASWLATLAGVLVSGVLWTFLATAAALRGRLLPALRDE